MTTAGTNQQMVIFDVSPKLLWIEALNWPGDRSLKKEFFEHILQPEETGN